MRSPCVRMSNAEKTSLNFAASTFARDTPQGIWVRVFLHRQCSSLMGQDSDQRRHGHSQLSDDEAPPAMSRIAIWAAAVPRYGSWPFILLSLVVGRLCLFDPAQRAAEPDIEIPALFDIGPVFRAFSAGAIAKPAGSNGWKQNCPIWDGLRP